MDKKTILDFLPIIVAIISAIVAYVFGKISEKRKNLNKLVEDSLQSQYTKLYHEVLDISTQQEFNNESASKFINNIKDNPEIYKLYDDEINFLILSIYVETKSNKITNESFEKEFKKLAKLIEIQYWNRLQVATKDLKWHIKSNVYNKWISIPLNLLFIVKDVFEYLSIISTFSIVFVLFDKMADNGVEILSKEIQLIILVLSVVIIAVYVSIISLYAIFSDNRNFKKRRLIKY